MSCPVLPNLQCMDCGNNVDCCSCQVPLPFIPGCVPTITSNIRVQSTGVCVQGVEQPCAGTTSVIDSCAGQQVDIDNVPEGEVFNTTICDGLPLFAVPGTFPCPPAPVTSNTASANNRTMMQPRQQNRMQQRTQPRLQSNQPQMQQRVQPSAQPNAQPSSQPRFQSTQPQVQQRKSNNQPMQLRPQYSPQLQQQQLLRQQSIPRSTPSYTAPSNYTPQMQQRSRPVQAPQPSIQPISVEYQTQEDFEREFGVSTPIYEETTEQMMEDNPYNLDNSDESNDMDELNESKYAGGPIATCPTCGCDANIPCPCACIGIDKVDPCKCDFIQLTQTETPECDTCGGQTVDITNCNTTTPCGCTCPTCTCGSNAGATGCDCNCGDCLCSTGTSACCAAPVPVPASAPTPTATSFNTPKASIQPAKAIASNQIAKTVQPIKAVQSTQSAQSQQSSQSSQSFIPTRPLSLPRAQPTQSTQSTQLAQNARTIQKPPSAQKSPSIQPSPVQNPLQTTQNSTPSFHAKPQRYRNPKGAVVPDLKPQLLTKQIMKGGSKPPLAGSSPSVAGCATGTCVNGVLSPVATTEDTCTGDT
ncbi:MAG: hypothetical protein Sylvanvirus18_1, partial [Sylvanvirus sp.]